MKTYRPLKKDYVRYATDGGLRLWDAMFTIRWHNLPPDEVADWVEFFDICRDEPSPYTERVIEAIKAGLCPLKGAAFGEGCISNAPGWAPERAMKEGFWYFVAGKEFKAPGEVPELSAPFPVTHYYGLVGWGMTAPQPVLFNSDNAYTWWARSARQRGRFERIWRFRHLQHAWGFLLGRL